MATGQAPHPTKGAQREVEKSGIIFCIQIEQEGINSSLTIFYKQEKRGGISLFLDPKNTDLNLLKNSTSPSWMSHVFDLQKTSIPSAKEYVFNKLQKIKEETSPSYILSYRWELVSSFVPRIKNDFFVQRVVGLLHSNEEKR